MQPRRAAPGHKQERARVDSPLDADDAQRPRHVRVHDTGDSGRRLEHAETERFQRDVVRCAVRGNNQGMALQYARRRVAFDGPVAASGRPRAGRR